MPHKKEGPLGPKRFKKLVKSTSKAAGRPLEGRVVRDAQGRVTSAFIRAKKGRKK